jgi:glycosyltransferase involved in cell wall biosynthesis
VVTTHPIQYYAPWFRHLAQRMRLMVLYAHRQDAVGQGEAGFGVPFDWDVDLLRGYPYRWLDNVARRPGGGSFFGYDTPEIREIIRRERFDAVLVLGWNYKTALQAVTACRRQGIPVVMRGDSHLETRRSVVKRAAKWPLYRALLPRFRHLYVGARNLRYLRHYGVPADRLFFAPHFVDNRFFREGAARARANGEARAIRRSLGIPERAFVCAYVGKFLPAKRIGDLIRACAVHTEADGPLHAVLVGDGPLRAELETMARKVPHRVHVAGFRNQSELPGLYAACDALALPSEAETWGLVVNEAMACGLLAVVSDAVGCGPDLIDPGRTGYTYPVGDVGALADALASARTLRAERAPELARALDEKMGTYSMEGATEGLVEALDVLAARARA